MQLVAAGFQVVRFDHRDIGESTRLDAPVPRPGRTLVRRHPRRADRRAVHAVGHGRGRRRADRGARLVGARTSSGVSLGGMIGQHLAIEHPRRVRSLVSIMSSPGGAALPAGAARAARAVRAGPDDRRGGGAPRRAAVRGDRQPGVAGRRRAAAPDRRAGARARPVPARLPAPLRGGARLRRSDVEAARGPRPDARHPRQPRSDVPAPRRPRSGPPDAGRDLAADRGDGPRPTAAAVADAGRGDRAPRRARRFACYRLRRRPGSLAQR